MISGRIQRIIDAVHSDEARLRAIEALPEETQQQYAPGIRKLRQRIYDERHALKAAPDDTEAWAKWLLEDFPYHEHPEAMRQTINNYLDQVERARQACDVRAMASAQWRLEQIIREAERSIAPASTATATVEVPTPETVARQERFRF